MRNFVILAAGCGLLVAGPAQAQKTKGAEVPAQVQRLMDCRAIAAPEERLGCFDRETAAMGQAIASSNLVVVDREQARAAKRSVFGFSVPNFGGLFGGGDDDVSQIESTIKSTSRNALGGWIITLADGSVWSQTDDWPGLDPRQGKTVIVKRGALGSFRLMIPGENGIKVKRIG
ncbi:MAG TPA: hypothetical protein VMK31_00845 [Sphingomicrobium sp.]|nr:hypothetical protein [Sphingomicrobium sp.]